MSDLEINPVEMDCSASSDGAGGVEVVTPREVPLGGIRAMLVHRTLPTRDRSMIGAWCFADLYGPERVVAGGGMRVYPHPHTGLQTVSWLFDGEIEHRDSAGVVATVVPGEINLMSAGFGISHSEMSTPATESLHGVQLWLALPDAVRNEPNGFQHHAPERTDLGGQGSARVFIGDLAGASSPIATATGLLGAELLLAPHAETTLEVDPAFEHGVLLDTDALVVDGAAVARGSLACLGPGRETIRLVNPTERDARIILLGGEPFDEEIIMWWNFVGRTHDEIVACREEWENAAERFGRVDGWDPDDRIPAPPLPSIRLTPRASAPRNRGRRQREP